MTFLFNKLVPLIKCESADMRDTIVNGLGYVNPAVLRYALYIFVFKVLHSLFFLFFLALDFCRFCVVIRVFSSPPQRPMTSDFEAFSIPEFIHYILFPFLILEKEPVFSLLNVQC